MLKAVELLSTFNFQQKKIKKMNNLSNKTQYQDNINIKKFFMFAAFLSTFFGYVVMKDLSLPSWLILTLGILGLGIIFLKGFSSPEFVFLLLVCYIPFSKVLVGDFGGMAKGLNLTNILTIFILIGWRIKSANYKIKFWDKSPLNKLIYIFIFIGFLSVLHSFGLINGDYFNVFTEFKRWITPIIFFFLSYNLVRTKNMQKSVIYTVMFIVFIVAIMAIRDYTYVQGVHDINKARIGGICEQPNQLAAFFVYYIFFYAGFFLINPTFKTFLLFIPMAAAFRGIMVTFSRGGYISFGFGTLGITFFRNKALFIFVVICMIFAILNPNFLPAGIKYRLGVLLNKDTYEGDIQEDIDKSSSMRIEAWKGAVLMMKHKPLTGIGYGLFYYQLPYYNPIAGNMDAHNAYLIMGAEQGIPAVIIFIIIVLVLIFNAKWILRNSDDKFYKSVALGFLGGLTGLLMSNMFGSRLEALEISGYFWILAGMVMRIRKELATEKQTRQPSSVNRHQNN